MEGRDYSALRDPSSGQSDRREETANSEIGVTVRKVGFQYEIVDELKDAFVLIYIVMI